jgi:hypothetical protein
MRLPPSSLVPLALLLACVHCHPASSSAQPNTSPMITLSPEVATLVSELARAKRVESALVGEGGDGSQVYQTFVKLKAVASPAELRALSKHKSPIVRAYVGEELAKQDKTSPEVQALRGDQTVIERQSGCKLHTQTIASLVGAAIAEAPSK